VFGALKSPRSTQNITSSLSLEKLLLKTHSYKKNSYNHQSKLNKAVTLVVILLFSPNHHIVRVGGSGRLLLLLPPPISCT